MTARKSDYFSIRLETAQREKLQRLAEAEGRMVSDGEMLRRLIDRAEEPRTPLLKAPAPRSSKRALGVEKLTKESGR